jgi:hypothetical protein
MSNNNGNAKEYLNVFFERATIAVSYSVANRITKYITSPDHSQAIKPAFTILALSLTIGLIFLNIKVIQNSGVQTSISILISQIFTTILPLPEEQKAYFALPSIVFYVLICSVICSCISYSLVQSQVSTALWDKIFRFVILFSSSIAFQILTAVQQMKLLYLIAFCYVIFAQFYFPQIEKPNFFLLFIDSIMCRAIVLCIQDYAKSAIDNMDISVVAFNAAILVIGHSLITAEDKIVTSQLQYCIGVMIFTVSRQLFAILQKYFDNEVLHTFMVTVTIFVVILYNSNWHVGKPIYTIVINCLSLAWTLLIETWLTSFNSAFEPYLVYFIVFATLQTLQESSASVVDFTEGIVVNKDQISTLYSYEMMAITHEASSTIGLPPLR